MSASMPYRSIWFATTTKSISCPSLSLSSKLSKICCFLTGASHLLFFKAAVMLSFFSVKWALCFSFSFSSYSSRYFR